MLLLAACSSGPAPQEAAGYAYTGPATLNIRGDLEPRAPTTATVRHGERLEILETRRRFVKVRTSTGAIGWTDSAYLLTQAQMDDLSRLADRVAALPSQGAATVFDTLNVHTDANRSAPSFAQLEEGNPIDVIAHRVTPRNSTPAAAPKTIAPPEHDSAAALPEEMETAEAEPEEDDTPRPPPAPAPAPPQGWTNLSHPRASELNGPVSHPSTDDWFLVRTPDGHAGWVLTRMVLMNIPDEVAQYAEGQFIMSYHALSEVHDTARGATKTNWLWTTSSLQQPFYDFDSFRVFVYSVRRHRYETAYIERNVRGHYPVEMVDLPDTDDPGFSLIVEEKDGRWLKRTYAFNGTRVRSISKVPYQPPPELPSVRRAETFDLLSSDSDEEGWTQKAVHWAKHWFQ